MNFGHRLYPIAGSLARSVTMSSTSFAFTSRSEAVSDHQRISLRIVKSRQCSEPGGKSDWGWIPKRPKVELLDEPPPRVRWLTDTERAKLDANLPTRIKRVALAGALTGIRLNNLLTLKRVDVDIPNRTIHLPKTKSGKRHHLPISDALVPVLEAAMADKAHPKDSRWVFVSRLGRPYNRNGATSLFRKCVAAAGIQDFHFHDLRHDFATRVRRAGHGLDVVQALLGHATPAMTQRYEHLGREDLKRAVDAVAIAAPALPPSPNRVRKKQQKKRAVRRRRKAS